MDKQALTVDEFCEAQRLSRATFYQLLRKGTGPKTYKVGNKRLISRTAAEAWQRDMEGGTNAAKA